MPVTVWGGLLYQFERAHQRAVGALINQLEQPHERPMGDRDLASDEGIKDKSGAMLMIPLKGQ